MLKKFKLLYLVPLIYIGIITINAKSLYLTLSLNTMPNFLAIYIPTIIVVFSLFIYFRNLITGTINQNRRSKILLFSFICFFVFSIILLVLTWPGIWIHDEYGLLELCLNLYPNFWHHWLTFIYYGIGLTMFMQPAGIIVFQIILVSLVFSYVFTVMYLKYKSRLKWMIILPFFFPSTIFYILNLFRITPYTFVSLFFFFSLFIYQKEKISKIPLQYLVLMTISYTLISTWRSEGIALLVLIPILVFILYRKQLTRKIYLLMSISIICSIAVNSFQSYHVKRISTKSDFGYKLTAFMNPLSMMTQIPNTFENDRVDWERIDRMIDSRLLEKHPSYVEIPAYWFEPDLINLDGNKEDYQNFLVGYVNLVTKHIPEFLNYRLMTMKIASNIGEEKANNFWVPVYSFCVDEITNCHLLAERFPSFWPLNEPIRVSFIKLITGTTSYPILNSPILSIFWNPIFNLVLMVTLMIFALYFKNIQWTMFSFMQLVYCFLVFVTTPAFYTMYYFPLIFLSFTMIPLAILDIDTSKGTIFGLIKSKSNKFILYSGLGFCVDVLTFTILTSIIKVPINIAYFLSALPAVTFVFLMTTRNIFNSIFSKKQLIGKYVLYILYQFVLLLSMSLLVSMLKNFILQSFLDNLWIIHKYIDVILKLIVTPLTLICNYFVIKLIVTKKGER